MSVKKSQEHLESKWKTLSTAQQQFIHLFVNVFSGIIQGIAADFLSLWLLKKFTGPEAGSHLFMLSRSVVLDWFLFTYLGRKRSKFRGKFKFLLFNMWIKIYNKSKSSIANYKHECQTDSINSMPFSNFMKFNFYYVSTINVGPLLSE